MRRRNSTGFTLLEVLVALAVLALSLGALISATASQARNSAYLVERTLAQWVALNAVAEYRLEGRWPEPGTRDGEGTMGERNWRWQAVTSTTSVSGNRALTRLSTSRPDAPGIFTSVKTKSKLSASVSLRPSSALVAVLTTCPMRLRASWMNSFTRSSSSITRMRAALVMPLPHG